MENFNEIFKRYSGYTATIARNYIHDEQTIDDILQKVFISFYKQNIDFKNEPSLMAWLKITTTRACLDHIKHVTRLTDNKKKYTIEQYNGVEPSTEIDSDERERAEIENYVIGFIVDEINKLPPRTKQAFKLYYFQEMTLKQIAKEMKISVPTVGTALQRARETLRMNILFNKKLRHF